MPSTLFDVFRPDPDDLLRRISRSVDDAMLSEIAKADFGRGARANLAKLRRIRDAGAFDVPLPWEPREVLELVRWSEPDDPRSGAQEHGERGHWKRAFACAALLRAAGEPDNADLRQGWNQTLIQLIGSLSALDRRMDAPAARLLAWLVSRVEDAEDADELAFLGVGLLWFALRCEPPLPDEALIGLSEWVDVQERQNDCGAYAGRWLLRTSFYDQRHPAWEKLGHALREAGTRRQSAKIRDWINLIGDTLAG